MRIWWPLLMSRSNRDSATTGFGLGNSGSSPPASGSGQDQGAVSAFADEFVKALSDIP